jgi:hypothetical protein
MTHRYLLALLFAALLLVACGGAAEPTSAPATPAPTATADGRPTTDDGPQTTADNTPLATPHSPLATDPIAAAVPQDPTTWPAPDAGAIHVDAGQRFGPVSPWVYGSNFDPGMVVPVALLDAASPDTGLRFMRFPGGSYGDLNTISPKQYDDFIALCRTLNAEPHIHVRYLDRTPADAAETVRYVNIEKGYGVRYWAIGNEAPFFYLDETADHYAAAWRDFAEAMLAVDPSIVLVGPDFSQFGPAELALTRSDVAEAREWTRVFLEANGDLLGLVTFHRYPFPLRAGLEGPTIAGLRPIAAEFDATIPELRAMIRETTGRDIPIGLTEVNSDSNKSIAGEATPDSPFAAVWLADVIGRFIRHGQPVVAQYAFQMRDSRGGWGLLERTRVRPQYYVYQLYRHFGDELVYAAADDPDVMVVAAIRDDGALTLMAVNLGDAPVERPLRLAGHAGGTAAVYRIDETNLVDLPAVPDGREAQPPLELADGATLTLPPRSATLYVLP